MVLLPLGRLAVLLQCAVYCHDSVCLGGLCSSIVQEPTGVARLLRTLGDIGIEYRDLRTRESSLEEIFVGLVHE